MAGAPEGGALGIAVLAAVFHQVYLSKLFAAMDAAPGPDLDPGTIDQLRGRLIAAEQTGLNPDDFAGYLDTYLYPAREASNLGYAVVFLVVTVISLVGAAAAWWLVRRPADPVEQEAGTTT